MTIKYMCYHTNVKGWNDIVATLLNSSSRLAIDHPLLPAVYRIGGGARFPCLIINRGQIESTNFIAKIQNLPLTFCIASFLSIRPNLQTQIHLKTNPIPKLISEFELLNTGPLTLILAPKSAQLFNQTNKDLGVIGEDEADIDERPRKAIDVSQVQQGWGTFYSPALRITLPLYGLRTTVNDWELTEATTVQFGAATFGVLERSGKSSRTMECFVHLSRDSSLLITGSVDQSVKLWSVKTGTQLFTFHFDSPTRSVDFAVGDKLAVLTTDPFMGLPSAIHVKHIASDPNDQSSESVLLIKGPRGRINSAVWGPLNKTIISAGEDAVIRIWDAETGKLLKESDKETGHKKAISSLSKSIDGSHFITGSLDKSAKLWDTRTLTLLKTYVTERPVNAVAMSPLLDHVVLGGGQYASAVTTTDHRAGKFEAKFYDKILQEEIGGVKGHFGPINALAFNSDGKSFASGGEDGYFGTYIPPTKNLPLNDFSVKPYASSIQKCL
ncbi:hypothetical protein M9H77_30726 [Catharanthus roseus]|uniref:Uncharacterized protein n=1 Tax=Catharanthus roseus TaxID=4058 RepID=A0ACB9ZYX5_CATRO|nr:hypothetical protein M9H77_30726 [Catharanthus roseus]